MTGEPGVAGAPRPLADEGAGGQDVFGLGEQERDAMLAWVGENLTVARRSASGQQTFYWILGIGFVVGLAEAVLSRQARAGSDQVPDPASAEDA